MTPRVPFAAGLVMLALAGQAFAQELRPGDGGRPYIGPSQTTLQAPPWETARTRAPTKSEAEDAMKISMSKRPLRRFLSKHLEALCGQDRDFLRRALRIPNGGTTIVLTHHAPSQMSLPPELRAEARCANRVVSGRR